MSTFTEFMQETEQDTDSQEPFFNKKKGGTPDYLDNISVQYKCFNITDPSDQSLVEEILTKSLRCGNQLAKDGDVAIFKEETSFDKEGNHFVALKYGRYLDNE